MRSFRYLEGISSCLVSWLGIDAQFHEDLLHIQGIGTLGAQPFHIEVPMLIDQMLAVIPRIARQNTSYAKVKPLGYLIDPRTLQPLPDFAYDAHNKDDYFVEDHKDCGEPGILRDGVGKSECSYGGGTKN